MTDTDFRTGAAGTLSADRLALFFHLSADYLIDPASQTGDIGTDIGCLHETIEEVIQSIIEATESNSQASARAFAALYLVRQARGVAAEYVRRTASAAATPAAPGTTLPGRAQGSTDERQALSDASCANNAVRQALDAIQEAVYSELGSVEQGMYEAAIASTERLDRALSRGVEAGSADAPALVGSAA